MSATDWFAARADYNEQHAEPPCPRHGFTPNCGWPANDMADEE